MAYLSRTKQKISPGCLRIGEAATLASTGAVHMNIPLLAPHVEFFPSSFRIDLAGKRIYVDPILTEPMADADFVLVTHSHPDHLSVKDIKQLVKPGTVVLCPKPAYRKLSNGLGVHSVQMVQPDESHIFDGLTIETIGAYNLGKGFKPHPASSGFVSYILTGDDIRIFHAGDTDVTPRMLQLENITVALVPIDGGNLTMDNESAAAFINRIKPRYVVPMHYSLGTDAPADFGRRINEGTHVAMLDGQAILDEENREL